MDHQDRRMYELEYPAPAVGNDASADGQSGPTLIVALHGYADAGHAIEASADHLKAALDNRLIASFNADELIDYRSRRPATTIDRDTPIDIESLDLDMRVLRDTNGKSFLLLSGPEPDMRWQGFTAAVTDLVDKFNVESTICVYAAPMPAPHTRPLVVTGHGNAAHLLREVFTLDSKVMVPGAAQLYIERALTKAGKNVAGFTAHVPHYLSASPYPQATLSLLDSLAATARISLPLLSLERDIERFNQQLEEQVGDSEEIIGVVRQLEEQYDSYMETYRERHPQAIMPGEPKLPSAEELSAEFERFLDAVGDKDDWREHLLHDDINDREDSIGRADGAGEGDEGPAGS